MPSPIPPKARGGVAILNLVDDDKDRRKQAVGILEGRLKYVEAICADVAAAASFGDDDAITKIKGLYKGVPPPVNSTGAVGGSRLASPGDHTHRGVTSIIKTAAVAGELIFTGAGVTQSGSTFDFATAPAASFVDNENLDAQCDGVATVFTLASTPSPAASLLLLVGFSSLGALGVWIQGVHYTLAGVTITKAGGVPTPPTGARMRAFYRD